MTFCNPHTMTAQRSAIRKRNGTRRWRVPHGFCLALLTFVAAASTPQWAHAQTETQASGAKWVAGAASVWDAREGRKVIQYVSTVVDTGATADEAKNKVMTRCQQKSTGTCKLLGPVDSGCVYVSIGSKYRKNTWGAGPTPEVALGNCKKGGFTCKIPVGRCVAPSAPSSAQPAVTPGNDTEACASVTNDADLRIKACSAVLERNATLGAAWGARAWTYLLKKQDYDRAIADFSKAIEYSSDDAPLRAGRGMAHEKKGDLERALADLSAAVRLIERADDKGAEAKRAWVFRARASVFEASRDKAGAIADYEKALNLNPQDSESRTQLQRLRAGSEPASVQGPAWDDPRMAGCRAIVVDYVRKETKADKLASTSTLMSVGADEADIGGAVIHFEDKFDIEIKDDGVFKKSLLDITRYLHATGKCR
jgi:hypothetical protein